MKRQHTTTSLGYLHAMALSALPAGTSIPTFSWAGEFSFSGSRKGGYSATPRTPSRKHSKGKPRR